MHTHIMRNLLLITRQIFFTGLFLTASFAVSAESFDAGVFEFQKKLADGGNAQAQFKLGNMYESGRGVTADMAAAVQWYEKSAANNFKPAKNRLTYLQIKKTGFKPEHKSWLSEVSADANAGDGEAMMILGELNEQGIGMPKNLSQAQIEYKRASTKGIPGSEAAYYAVSDTLSKQKQQSQQEDEKRMAAEKARKEEADREAQRKRMAQEQEQQRQAQVRAENEQRKQEEERRRAEAQRRQLEEQKKEQAKQEAAASKPAETEKKEEAFESDLCTGKAASFRTQCR